MNMPGRFPDRFQALQHGHVLGGYIPSRTPLPPRTPPNCSSSTLVIISLYFLFGSPEARRRGRRANGDVYGFGWGCKPSSPTQLPGSPFYQLSPVPG